MNKKEEKMTEITSKEPKYVLPKEGASYLEMVTAMKDWPLISRSDKKKGKGKCICGLPSHKFDDETKRLVLYNFKRENICANCWNESVKTAREGYKHEMGYTSDDEEYAFDVRDLILDDRHRHKD